MGDIQLILIVLVDCKPEVDCKPVEHILEVDCKPVEDILELERKPVDCKPVEDILEAVESKFEADCREVGHKVECKLPEDRIGHRVEA